MIEQLFPRTLRSWLAGILATLLISLLYIWLDGINDQRRIEQQHSETLSRTAALRARLEGEMNALLYLCSGLAHYVAINPRIDQEQFERYAALMYAASPLLRNITLAPANIVRYVFPHTDNQAALGLDLYNHPQQGAATRRMMAGGQMVIAGPVALVQGGEGLIVRIPIYVAGDYWGLTSIPIRLHEFYQRVGLLDRDDNLKIALRGQDGLGAAGRVFYGDPELFAAGDAIILDVDLLAGSWQIAAIPVHGWGALSRQRLLRLLPGFLIALMAGFFTWKMTTQADNLRKSEANYRELIENVNSIVLRWRADGTITYINSYGLQLLGYEREELVGHSVVGTIVPPSENGGRDLSALMADMARRPEKYAENENENICRDGRRLWISWSNRAIFGPDGQVCELLSIGVDHTRRRETELALQRSEARFRSMVSHIQSAIYRCEPEPSWRVEYISDQVEQITGYPVARFMDEGRDLAEVIHPADRSKVAAKIREAMAANLPFEMEYRILAADGSLRWVHDRGQAVRDENDQLRLEGGLFDISSRKQVESQLRRAHDTAKAANKAKSAFLANMSHELRTPLNAIIGYSEILLEDATAGQRQEQVADLEKIRSAGKHLQKLISEVLEFSKTEAGKTRLEPEECEVAVLLADLVAVVQPLIAERGNRLGVETAPDLGKIYVDTTRLRQVLYNLLGNAAKFTENGFITLRARRVIWEGEQWMQFDIQDTGIGISEEQQTALFKPFSQADASITRRFGGTGLGLAISRYFCRMMGGDISVSSVPGAGSTFTVSLPATDNPQCPLAAGEEAVI